MNVHTVGFLLYGKGGLMSSIKEWRESFKRYVHFPKTKLDYWTFRKLRSLKSKQTPNKDWVEWLKYQARDVQLSPTIHEQVQEGSYRNLLTMWMQNFAENLDYIRYGDDVKREIPQNYHQQTIADLVQPTPLVESDPDYIKSDKTPIEHQGINVKNPPAGSAVVVGRGPSLFKNKHCEMLAEAIKNGEYKSLIITSDGGLVPLLDAGVVPDAVVTVDGSPVIKKFFEHPLLQEYGSKIKWIVSVTVSPEVYQTARKAKLQPYWFSPTFDDWRQNESWTRLQVLMTRTNEFKMGVPRASAGGNAGACAWIMAMSIFKRAPIALIGIDFGYPEGTKLEDTQYYSSVLKIAEGNVAKIKEAYKEFYHPTFKTKAFCDLVFYHYRQAFIEMNQETEAWYRLFGGTVNCTEGGTLWGQNITCMPFSLFLKEHKT